MSNKESHKPTEKGREQITRVIILGSSGDLAFRRIYPAINKVQDVFNKTNKKIIEVILFCNYRSEENLRTHIEADPDSFTNIKDRITIVPGSYDDLSPLKKYAGNAAVFLSIPPKMYFDKLQQLISLGFDHLAIEKPYATDFNDYLRISKLLNDSPQVKYKFIDHFISKPLSIIASQKEDVGIPHFFLNNKYISSCRIELKESITTNGRKYFDATGTTKDMLMNHAIQYFRIFNFESKVIENLLSKTTFDNSQSIFGQYKGYRAEMEDSETNTETFACVVANIDSERWRGVPFLLYSGKAMSEKSYKIIYEICENKIIEICKTFKIDYNKTQDTKMELIFNVLEHEIYLATPKKQHQIYKLTPENFSKHLFEYEGIFEALLDSSKDERVPFAKINEVKYFWKLFDDVLKSKKEKELYFYDEGYGFESEISSILDSYNSNSSSE